MPGFGGEFPGIPSVFTSYEPMASGAALDAAYTGPTYWKIPQMPYPTLNQVGLELD